jgi:hypothetical protein
VRDMWEWERGREGVAGEVTRSVCGCEREGFFFFLNINSLHNIYIFLMKKKSFLFIYIIFFLFFFLEPTIPVWSVWTVYNGNGIKFFFFLFFPFFFRENRILECRWPRAQLWSKTLELEKL